MDLVESKVRLSRVTTRMHRPLSKNGPPRMPTLGVGRGEELPTAHGWVPIVCKSPAHCPIYRTIGDNDVWR
eukprot:scaffold615_cov387-Pavlova_lutheri.AAC.1